MAEFYIIAVGYDQESKCELLSAMMRDENSFTPFGCRWNPVVKPVEKNTIHGRTLSLVLTPSLNTPAWVKVKEKFLQPSEKQRAFVYVRSDFTNADDESSLESFEKAFTNECIMKVYCFNKKNANNLYCTVEDDSSTLKFQTDANWSTKAHWSKVILEKIAENVFKPKPASDESGPSEVGAEKQEYTTEQQQDDQSRRRTIEKLLSTVQVSEQEFKPCIREKLTKEDWDNFQQALRHGTARSNHVRVNVVGNHGVGKTTVIDRLLMKKIQCPNQNPKPTENLAVHHVTARCTEETNGKKSWETDTNGTFLEDLNIQRMAQAMKQNMNGIKRADSGFSSIDTQSDSMSDRDNEKARQHTVITQGEASFKLNKGEEDDEDKCQASKQNLKLDMQSKPQNPARSDDTHNSHDSTDFLLGSEEVTEDTSTDELLEPVISNLTSPIEAPKGDQADRTDKDEYRSELKGTTDYRSELKDKEDYRRVLKDKEGYLRKVLHCIDKDEKEKMYVSYWDYAGQSTYYATHQLFLSPSAVYLLVVDLRKDLDDKIDDNLDFNSGLLQSCTVADAIKFWALSVQAYTKDDHGGYAPFIVVGTHRGNIKGTEIVEKKFNAIRKLLDTNAECIAIDNTLQPEKDDNLTVLRNRIIDVGLSIIDEQVSSQWINLEYDMQRSKTYEDGYLKFSKLQELDKHLDVPMNNVERLEAFLCHQHYRGHLLFYDHPELKDLIITDPMFLVNFLNMLFRRKMTSRRSRGRNEDGILNHRYINDVAKELQIEDFVCMTLLNILVELHIVHPLDPDTSPGNEERYFLPCMLNDKPTKDQTEPDECDRSPVFQIRFDHDCLYQSTFHQIVCALMKSMPVMKEDEKQLIYNLYVCFDVKEDQFVWLVLYWKNSKIDFFIEDFAKEEKMSEYVDYVYDKLDQAIEEVLFVNKHENVSYDFWVECPKHKQPTFVSLTQLKKKGKCMCLGGEHGGRHAVKLQEIPAVMVDESKDQQEQDPTMLEKPSDKVLGRLAWKLASLGRETAANLALRLKLHRALAKADIATRDYNDWGLKLLHILVTWRNHRETDRTYSFLLNRLTKTKDYDHSTLKEAMFSPSVTDPRFNSIPHDVKHGDKDITIISDHLAHGYPFVLLELDVKWHEIAQERRNNRDDTRETIRQLLLRRRRADPDNLPTQKILEAVFKVLEESLDPILTKLQK